MVPGTPSYAQGASAVPLLGETVGAVFERMTAMFPDRQALVSCQQDLRFTYRELDAAANRLAQALLALGLERGDRIAIWSPNRAEWVVTQLAAAKVGGVLVPVNPASRGHELAYVLTHSAARLLLAVPEFKASDYVAMVEEVREGCPALERIAFFDSPSFEQLLDLADTIDDGELRRRSATLDFDDPVSVLYTSGTTGAPKGATLTHHNVVNNGFHLGELLRYREDDRVCVPVPLFHCFGMVASNLAALTHGAAIVLPGPAFEPGAVLAAVERERCTSLVGVPAMFIAELNHPELGRFDLRSLRTGLIAGAPSPAELVKRAAAHLHMPQFALAYGMTETSPASAQTPLDDDLDRRAANVGRPHPHVELKVVHRSGATAPRGETGELCVRGYSVMRGYWNDPVRTQQAIDPQGWLHTGDLARIDGEGYVSIVGRIKDIVLRGGESVSAAEVEEFLYTHPAVVEAYVIGVPDELLGEELMAWVKVRPSSMVTPADIREFCRGRIAHFKIPRFVRFCDEFPLTASGKVQKFRLREMAVEELGLSEAPATTS